jgi:hypothetical protein
MFNFTKVGMYIDALQVGSDDYIVNVGCYGCYISMNGTNGVQIGSAAASQTNLEGISINNSQIEGNGSQGILFNGYIINGFSAIGNVIQWNNIQSIYANYYELYSSASGVIAGGTITGNYFEMDTVFGSNDVGAINASSNWADVSFGSNYFLPNNLNAKQLYSAAGIAVPACNSGAYVWHQTLTVSDATACTRGTTYTSGGSTQCDISCSGTNWIESGAATY